MKEFIAILAELEKSNREGKTTVLTTVIAAQGSTYRRAGPRLIELIQQFGTVAGYKINAQKVSGISIH